MSAIFRDPAVFAASVAEPETLIRSKDGKSSSRFNGAQGPILIQDDKTCASPKEAKKHVLDNYSWNGMEDTEHVSHTHHIRLCSHIATLMKHLRFGLGEIHDIQVSFPQESYISRHVAGLDPPHLSVRITHTVFRVNQFLHPGTGRTLLSQIRYLMDRVHSLTGSAPHLVLEFPYPSFESEYAKSLKFGVIFLQLAAPRATECSTTPLSQQPRNPTDERLAHNSLLSFGSTASMDDIPVPRLWNRPWRINQKTADSTKHHEAFRSVMWIYTRSLPMPLILAVDSILCLARTVSQEHREDVLQFIHNHVFSGLQVAFPANPDVFQPLPKSVVEQHLSLLFRNKAVADVLIASGVVYVSEFVERFELRSSAAPFPSCCRFRTEHSTKRVHHSILCSSSIDFRIRNSIDTHKTTESSL